MSSPDNKTRRAESLPTEQRDGLTMDNESPIETASTSQSTTTDTLRAKCRRIVRRMDECPQAFAAFAAHVRESIAADQNWMCGSDELRRFIGGKDFIDSRGRTFGVRHGYDSVYIRELCRRNRDIASHIRLHRSRYDAIYHSPYSGEYVAALKLANTHPDELGEA